MEPRRMEDPLARVMNMGERAARVGIIAGLILALIPHGAASAKAVSALYPMAHFVDSARSKLHDYFWTIYDVEPTKKAETPPPEAAPEPPPPPPEPKAPAPKPLDEPYEPDKAPPKPSQASKVITDDKAVVDMTGKQWAVVSGEGDALGGQQSANGEGNQVVKAPMASNTGVVGGTGTTPAPTQTAAPPKPDMSRPASLKGSTSWNCPFPPEADADQINEAVVQILVTVRPDGSPQSVKVLSDPGHGFGRAARTCALSRTFNAAFDRDGAPIAGTTPPMNVRFTR